MQNYNKLPEETESYMHSEELYAYVQSKTQTSMSFNIFPLKTRRDAECTLWYIYNLKPSFHMPVFSPRL